MISYQIIKMKCFGNNKEGENKMREKTMFMFKSHPDYYWREKDDIKNNTVREIDLDDDRFTNLITWMETGWNDGDIKIRIQKGDNHKKFFERDICDICIWKNFMIITWHSKTKTNNVRNTS